MRNTIASIISQLLAPLFLPEAILSQLQSFVKLGVSWWLFYPANVNRKLNLLIVIRDQLSDYFCNCFIIDEVIITPGLPSRELIIICL